MNRRTSSSTRHIHSHANDGRLLPDDQAGLHPLHVGDAVRWRATGSRTARRWRRSCLVAGLYVAEVHDHTVTPLGTLYGTVAVVATVPRSAHRLVGSGGSASTPPPALPPSPLIALAMLAPSPPRRRLPTWRRLEPDRRPRVAPDRPARSRSPRTCPTTTCSAVRGPLTYQVLGHVKTIATIGATVLVLRPRDREEPAGSRSMVGVVSYTEVTRRASASRASGLAADGGLPAPAVAARDRPLSAHEPCGRVIAEDDDL